METKQELEELLRGLNNCIESEEDRIEHEYGSDKSNPEYIREREELENVYKQRAEAEKKLERI